MSETRFEWRVSVAGEQTSAILETPTAPASGALFVCGHGAGGHMGDRGMLALSEIYRRLGVHVVRFNFLYRERGAGRPDPMPRLEQCVAAVAAYARRELQPKRLIIGGRSMGGRAASMLCAKAGSEACELSADGLLLLAYPLHPAGEPGKLRDAHLASIRLPALCLNGTRDSLCRQDLMDRVAASLSGNWRMHWLQDADHSFHVLKSSGRSDADVLNEIADVSAEWIAALQGAAE